MENEITYPPQRGGSPDVPNADPSVDPSIDFYKYINHTWQSHVKLPSFKSSFGVSEEIEAEVEERLMTLVKESDHPLAKLSQSFLHSAAQVNSIVDLTRMITGLHCISDTASLAKSMGAFNSIQCKTPLSCVISSDAYNSSNCSIYLYQVELGMPQKSNYRSAEVLHKYRELLADLAKLLHIESLDEVVDLEISMIPYMMSGDDLRDTSTFYNPMRFHELVEKYKFIPWMDFFRAWGLNVATLNTHTFINTNPKYLRHLNSLFHTMDLKLWIKWMSSMVILNYLEYLPPPYDDIHFEFFCKLFKGTMKKLPQRYLTLKVLKDLTPNDLGKLYVDTYVPKDTKAYTQRMVDRLVQATIERLSAIDWMARTTRDSAVRKVKAMKTLVAYPKHWKSETAEIKIQTDRPLYNMLLLATRDTKEMIRDLGSGCAKSTDDWEDGVFEVNAYYYPEGNAMVVPAGILQPPFLDLDRSDAWNLGGIGSAIGHEITHGFDEEGRLYNEQGNYNDWWTPADSHVFKRLTKSVDEAYNGVEYMGGRVNGQLTLSENLADLGGVAIALHALKSTLSSDPATRRAAYRDFFTSYAVSWRIKDRAKKARQSLSIDVHAPAQLRVNIIVRQFAEFYEAFDIGPDAAGWITPEKRIQLW